MPKLDSVIKIRLGALGIAAGVAGILIAIIVLELQQKAVDTRARLGEVDLESFRIADLFKEKLRQANDQMRRHCTDEDPHAWEEFQKSASSLRGWIEGEAARLKAPAEQQLLRKMESSHETYMQKAGLLHSIMATNRSRAGATVAEFNQFLDQARQFMDLSQELGRAHFESRNDLLGRTSRTLTELRMSVLGLLALLFVIAGALAISVYKNLIAPLRVKLVETQALVERNEKLASLGLLAAGVAHEIRNPLTAIKTALFLQQKKFSPGSPERADGEIVEREILRLDRIVTNFLQFARPTEPEPEVISADLPLREAERLLAPQLATLGIQLVREESSPLRIRADPAQLKQVLINLVQNAADSMTGGKITLRARPDRELNPAGETDVVILEVVDTGKGITPEIEKRLFDPFFTTKESGTGLGLPIAARIVEINGGSLQYQTQVNRGSTFGIVMPRVLETGITEPQNKSI
jgi:signal transduction histidine kinase